MTSAVDKTSGGTVLSTSTYDYDAFGNRVEQDVTVSSVTTAQRYAYDGWNPATQGGTGNTKWEVFADLDGSNNLETRYLRGDEVDQLFARVGSTGTAAWLLTDHLGSVVGVTDNSGTVQATIAYDAFGNVTSPGSSWAGRYGWTGREFDATTGLQYNRARYYYPQTGQWTSQDPMGFDAGDSNLYRYVNNTPTLVDDPSGLQDPQGGTNAGDGTVIKKIDLSEFKLPPIPLGPLGKANGRGSVNITFSATDNPKLNTPPRVSATGRVQMQWEISKGLEIDTKDINAMLRATKIPGLAIPDCVEISGYG